MDFTHLLETEKEKQARYKSTGSFNPSARCGNGSFHAVCTENPRNVTCPACLAIMEKKNA